MGDFIFFAAVLVCVFLLGALPFAVLTARLFGLPDPRTYGSGNPGATNVARAGGKPPAALTFLGDFGKGFVPVFLLGGGDAPLFAAAGAAAVAGHVFSPFLRFRGGKGVATAFGVFLAWNPPAAMFAAAIWLSVFFACRISAAASVAAISAAAILTALFGGAMFFAAAFVGVLVVCRHRGNFSGMARGSFGKTEPGEFLPAFAKRFLRAAVVLFGVVAVAASVHDYPQTRYQIHLIRSGDEVATKRRWIAVFLFLNEFGGGVKYALTGNKKYMLHYPTSAYLRARREEYRARVQNTGADKH